MLEIIADATLYGTPEYMTRTDSRSIVRHKKWEATANNQETLSHLPVRYVALGGHGRNVAHRIAERCSFERFYTRGGNMRSFTRLSDGCTKRSSRDQGGYRRW